MVSIQFTPFPANSIRGGYLSWSQLCSPVPLIWHEQHNLWQIQYPISGIELDCFQDSPGHWKLRATTYPVGTGPEIPLITGTYSRSEGLVETYRYTYPPGYAHPQDIGRYLEEMDQVQTCFRGIADLLLATDSPTWGPPLRPGQLELVSVAGGEPSSCSWHLLDDSGGLYVLLGLFERGDGEEEILWSGPIYKDESRLPLAFLSPAC